MMTPRWYVARTETNAERRAADFALRRGVEAYIPLMTHGALMFPCYAFLLLAEMMTWAELKRDGYVFSYLLGYVTGVPSPVPNAIIENLKSREINGVIPVEERVLFDIGQRVRVARGRYADMFGLVQRSSEGRVAVLLSLFNRPLTVVMRDALVIPA